jgi:uncharacterized protein (TIGR02246 family)
VALSTDDVLAIQQLAARYNHAVDSGDGAGFAATFTEEGALVTGERIQGRATLAAFGSGLPDRLPRSRHRLTNLLVEADPADPDSAHARAYLTIDAAVGDGGARVPLQSGIYADTLRRVDGEWLFVERVFTAD